MKKITLFFSLLFFSIAWGDEAKQPIIETLAEQATDFTAPLLQLQLEDCYHYTVWGSSSTANTFIARPVVPIAKTKSIPFQQLIRFSTYVITTPKMPHHLTGVGDTQFFDLLLHDVPEWGRIGFGPMMILPTATSQSKLGQGKWQIGPAFAAMLLAVPCWQFGVLLQNPWACIGNSSRKNVVSLFVQPLIAVHLKSNWYLISNAQMTFQWNPHFIQVPLNIGIGKVATIRGQPINAFMEAEWVVYKTHAELKPHFTVKVGFNFLFPDCKPTSLDKAGYF